MPAPEPLAARRGYAVTDLSHATVSYVFIKADAAEAARAIAETFGGTARDILPPNPIPEEVQTQRGKFVFQFKGHPWSIFMGTYDDHADGACKISKAGCDVLSFCNENTSGWSDLVLYRNGEEVEHLSWGLDYSEEMEEFEEEAGAGADAAGSGWDAEATVVTDAEMEMQDSYLFRSKLREATTEDLQRGEGFVDETFRYHDAYFMDIDEQPVPHHKTGKLKAGKSGVDALAAVWGTIPG